jgi:addiction module RelE/StbE family toxin
MKKITFSSSFQKKLGQLQKKDKKLFEKIKKQFSLFKLNSSHPSLRIHKLKGELKAVWSLSVTMDFRLLFVEDSEYYFFDMGTHDQVYKK